MIFFYFFKKKTNRFTIYSFLLNNIFNLYSINFCSQINDEIRKFTSVNIEYINLFEPLIIWHPCSYDCKESIFKVSKVYKFMVKIFPELALLRKKYLSKTIILNGLFSIILNDNKKYFRNDEVIVEYDSVLPFPKNYVNLDLVNLISSYCKIIIKNGVIISPSELKGLNAISFK